MVKVLVVGQTPPPYHGQAIMIERLVQGELSGVELIHVRMAFSANMDEVGAVGLRKIFHLLALVVRIVYRRFASGARVLYYPPAGPDRTPMIRDLVVLLATRWLFDRTVLHFHAGGVSQLYDELPGWQRWLFRRAYFGADAAVRMSELNPEDGRRLEARREYVVPYGIDDPWAATGGLAAKSTADSRDGLRLLFVGALRESKGLLVLVEACGDLADRGVPFQLEVMGQWQSEEFTDRVMQRIEQLGLGERVRLLGVLTGKEKFAAYRRADVFCFPTFYRSEASPVVLLEAMASGLPVVATRWRGIPSIVVDGETGVLVEPHNPRAVADALAELAGDHRRREQLGSAGRRRFERQYTLVVHLERMRQVFSETANAARPEAASVRSQAGAT